jgi:hypothetical protein
VSQALCYRQAQAALLWAVASLVIHATCSTVFAADAPRFTIAWTDGTLSTAASIDGWLDAPVAPRAEGRPLADRQKPARWIADTRLTAASQSAATPEGAYVEFFGGDRLPGRLTRCQPGGDGSSASWPASAEIDLTVSVDPPGLPPRKTVRIATDPLQRVVWLPHTPRRYEPSTLFRRDGGRIVFRTLRWSADSVRLLTDDGVRSFPFEELAEVHLPLPDAWDAYCRQLATLTPEGRSRLVVFDGPGGLRLTTSWERLHGWSTGADHNYDHGQLVVQPAWCLEALWVKLAELQRATFFAVEELPLVWQEPVRSRHRTALSAGWDQWQRDRNSQLGPLVSGGRAFGWGLGVHAHHELDFAVPPLARSFATRFGIDAAAGHGGSVLGRVDLLRGSQTEPTDPARFVTPLLIGSERASVPIEVSIDIPDSEPARLRLVADAALDAQAPGADPFDLRDVCDWLEPYWRLDADRLRPEIARRVATVCAALHGLTVAGTVGKDFRLENAWDPAARPRPEFRARLIPVGTLRLSRTLHVEPEHTELRLLWARPDGRSTPSELEVRVDGNLLARLPTPVFDETHHASPIIVRLEELIGREVTVEVTLRPSDGKSFVELKSE